MKSSETITRSAPKAAASARAARTRARFPAMSPTVQSICARPMTRRFVGAFWLVVIKGTSSGGPVRRQASLRGIGAAAFDPFRLEQLGDEKSHFDRLLGIEPWIAISMVTVMQVRLRDSPRAAGAFGDILSGHFEMHAAGVSALRPVDRKKRANLAHDLVERPRFVATRRLDRIAVHRVAGPNNTAPFPSHGADQTRQTIGRLAGATPANQGETAGFVRRIENVDEPQQLVRRKRGAAFEPERVFDPARIFHMSMARMAGAVADPEHMTRSRIMIAGRRIDPGQRFLIAEQQSLVRGIKIGLAQFLMCLGIEADRAHKPEGLGDPVREFVIAGRLRAVLDEAEHPAMRIFEIGIAAGGT